MNSFGEKNVVSPLKRIPGDVPAAASGAWALRVQSTSEVREPGHRLDHPNKLSGDEAERRVRQQRVHKTGHSTLDRPSPVKAKPRRIQELRTEDVLLMERDELAPRHDGRQQLVKRVRLDDSGVVPHIRRGEAVPLRELAIDFGGEIIFRRDLLPGKAEDSGIATPKERSVR